MLQTTRRQQSQIHQAEQWLVARMGKLQHSWKVQKEGNAVNQAEQQAPSGHQTVDELLEFDPVPAVPPTATGLPTPVDRQGPIVDDLPVQHQPLPKSSKAKRSGSKQGYSCVMCIYADDDSMVHCLNSKCDARAHQACLRRDSNWDVTVWFCARCVGTTPARKNPTRKCAQRKNYYEGESTKGRQEKRTDRLTIDEKDEWTQDEASGGSGDDPDDDPDDEPDDEEILKIELEIKQKQMQLLNSSTHF